MELFLWEMRRALWQLQQDMIAQRKRGEEDGAYSARLSSEFINMVAAHRRRRDDPFGVMP